MGADETVENSLLNIGNIQIIFGHLLYGMHGQIVLPTPDPLSDSFDA